MLWQASKLDTSISYFNLENFSGRTSLFEYIKRMDKAKILLVVLILCTIVSGFVGAIPVYESPTITVTYQEIPEYEFSITSDT